MLDLEFKLSKQFLFLLLIVLLMSMLMVQCVSVTSVIKGSMLFIIIAYGSYLIWQFVLLRGRDSCIGIHYLDGNEWLIRTNRGQYQATLCGDSTVTIWVSILRFKIPNQFWKKSCIVFCDSLSQDAYRKLLVRLKMG